MIDFFELEKKCKQKRRKKFFKIFSFIIFLSAIILAIFIYNTPKPQKLTPPITKPKKSKPKTIEKNITKPKIKPQPKVIKKEKNTTKPKPKPKEIPIPTLDVDIDFNNIENNIENNVSQKTIEKNATQPKKKKLIKEKTITLEDALLKASEYYEKDDYTNSIKWCKIASKIDNTDERIWELYALNLAKIGQKDTAIRVLKTYLEYKDSKQIQKTLKRLEND